MKQLKKYPLVTNGLISQGLIEILIIPHVDNTKSNTKNHRYTTKAGGLTAISHQQLIKEKGEEKARKGQARIDRELKRTAKKNKRNTKDLVKYLKKIGITLSEQNQCDPGPSTTNASTSKEENTKKVELNFINRPK